MCTLLEQKMEVHTCAWTERQAVRMQVWAQTERVRTERQMQVQTERAQTERVRTERQMQVWTERAQTEREA